MASLLSIGLVTIEELIHTDLYVRGLRVKLCEEVREELLLIYFVNAASSSEELQDGLCS